MRSYPQAPYSTLNSAPVEIPGSEAQGQLAKLRAFPGVLMSGIKYKSQVLELASGTFQDRWIAVGVVV